MPCTFLACFLFYKIYFVAPARSTAPFVASRPPDFFLQASSTTLAAEAKRVNGPVCRVPCLTTL
jgi:hypothetical protein